MNALKLVIIIGVFWNNGYCWSLHFSLSEQIADE